MTSMASYPSQCEINQHQHQQEQEQERNEPCPLRIVKRHRSTEVERRLEENQYVSADDYDNGIAHIIAGTQQLQVSKRRSRRRRDLGIRAEFASSLAELNSAHKKAWSEAVFSCRGLLRKSTPDMRGHKRFLSFGQTSSSHSSSSSSRTSSGNSSLPRGSTDDGRRQISSVSSYEADFAGSAPVGSPQQLSPRRIAKNTGGYILSPRIVATAHNEETKLSQISSSSSSATASSSFSSSTATIPPFSTAAEEDEQGGRKSSGGTFVNHKIDRYFDFGCLYDLTAEVHSTQDATVVEVIQEQSWPTTIYAGTSVLLIVHLQLNTADNQGAWGHSRCRSEELMDELELQLGDVQTQLMSVKISYLHSAFPKINNPCSTEDGLCHLESRMETTATAALVRNCSSSVWASRNRASTQSSLFPLMVQHWGDEKALEVQRRISDSQLKARSPGGHPQYSSLAWAANQPLDFGCPGESAVIADQPVDQDDAESRWKAWSGQGTERPDAAEENITTPAGAIYYFGEKAIKALQMPTAGLERDGGRRRPSRNKHKAATGQSSKEKDLKFWDWGSWF
ncbi:hypothetical protein E4U09_005201 [Claviceps aff. purpurea]|uniref:Uncharacterized protein n=1 Tax=Claviceps aff. purpurea TaxID=1967640 RepID=A0A9P7U8U0_9HYPO|nr:hypothetical protein E4U09_005201 [Claviceps aff. purpurea]